MQMEESNTAGKGVRQCSAGKPYHSEYCSATFSSPASMHQLEFHLEQAAVSNLKRVLVD
jgi:hypothetical protein